jgi:hypothetical protein
MNSKRLLRVADHLETVARKDFDIASNENCAVGHAARLPYFKRIGLKFGSDGDFEFNGADHKYAIADLFDLRVNEVEQLFMLGGYKKDPTPKQVAKAIRKFVNEHS